MRFFSLMMASAVGLSGPTAPAPVRYDPLLSIPPIAYRAVVQLVIDSATVEVRVRLHDDREITTIVHLRHVRAPDPGSSCPEERTAAEDAAGALTALLPAGSRVMLSAVGPDPLAGDVRARIWVWGAGDLGRWLWTWGHAVRVGEAGTWCGR